jgi:beta-phosphoglucomutase-like phosphatase (HAD superfamily)
VTTLIALQDFDAVLFDLDGVLTTTRAVHAAAWKQMFDGFLDEWDNERGTHTSRFDDQVDYATFEARTRTGNCCWHRQTADSGSGTRSSRQRSMIGTRTVGSALRRVVCAKRDRDCQVS